MFLLTLNLHGPHGQILRTRVPCPRRDFVAWLALGRNQTESKIDKLLRRNPILLLAALSQTVNCSGAAIESPRQLTQRLQHCFTEGNPLDTLTGPIVAVEELKRCEYRWNAHFESALKTFQRSRSQNELVKSLSNFSRLCDKAYVPKSAQTKKRSFKTLLKSSIGDSFRWRKRKTKQSAADWKPHSKPEPSCDVVNSDSVIVSLLGDRVSGRLLFESRLHDAKLLAMKQLAYGASHEINNPLANIATRAQAMLANELDPDRRYRLAVIHEQAMRAHDMISDMMLFAHPPELNRAPTNVRLMLANLKRECESNLAFLAATEIELRITVGVGVSHASLDKTQCKVLLASLIRNAAEAMRNDDGQIEVSAYREQGQLCFCVADNGIGVDDAVKPHLFDPFFSGREAGRGLGFGLPKSWRIAQLHGGSLTHESTSSELGTQFVFRLPTS